jgi:osmotically-inducible protein OsmY
MRLQNRWLCIGFTSLGLVLGGCAPLDTRPYTAQDEIQDQAIQTQIRAAFNHEKRAFLDHVDITVRHGDVWLTGLAFDAEDVARAKKDALETPGVVSVKEDIFVSPSGGGK